MSRSPTSRIAGSLKYPASASSSYGMIPVLRIQALTIGTICSFEARR